MRRDDPEAVAERRREVWRDDRWHELRTNPALLVEAIDDRTYRQSPGALLDLLNALSSNEGERRDRIATRYHAAERAIERLIQEVVDKEEQHREFSE